MPCLKGVDSCSKCLCSYGKPMCLTMACIQVLPRSPKVESLSLFNFTPAFSARLVQGTGDLRLQESKWLCYCLGHGPLCG